MQEEHWKILALPVREKQQLFFIPVLTIYNYNDFNRKRILDFKIQNNYTAINPYLKIAWSKIWSLLFCQYAKVVISSPFTATSLPKKITFATFNNINTITSAFINKSKAKQASIPFQQRSQIKKHIYLKKQRLQEISHLLLIDDIITSGSTIKAHALQLGLQKKFLLAFCLFNANKNLLCLAQGKLECLKFLLQFNYFKSGPIQNQFLDPPFGKLF